MSTAPETSKGLQKFKSCWSCRLLSGGGLIMSGVYVLVGARNVMRGGVYITMGTVAQITFALSLAAWGVVIIADPVGKTQKTK